MRPSRLPGLAAMRRKVLLSMRATAALEDVLARPDVWCANRLASAAIPTLSSGFAQLDAELPGGGWPRGVLTEILVDGTGVGECSLLLPVFRQLARVDARTQTAARWSMLVAPPHATHAPTWIAALEPAPLLIASPGNQRDLLWTMEQALANGALGSVLCWARQIDVARVRRLQVAVDGNNTLAFLFRPLRAQSETSAAVLRLAVSAGSGGKLNVEFIKRRGPPCHHRIAVDISQTLTEQGPRQPLLSSSSERPVNHGSLISKPSPTAALARHPFAAFGARGQRPFTLT